MAFRFRIARFSTLASEEMTATKAIAEAAAAEAANLFSVSTAAEEEFESKSEFAFRVLA